MWYTNVVRRTLVEMIPTPSFFVDLPKMEKIVCHIGVGSSTEKRSHVLRPMVLLTLLTCLLYTSPSPRDRTRSRMPSSA